MKKSRTAFIICVLLLAFSQSAYAAEDIPPLTGEEGFEEWIDIIPGDVDLDGKITAIDSNFLNRHIAGTLDFNEDQKSAGDINGDRTVNALDSNLLKRMLAGLS